MPSRKQPIHVTIRGRFQQRYVLGVSPTDAHPNDPPVDTWGEYWRPKGKIWRKTVINQIWLDGVPVEEAIKRIREGAEGLSDPVVSVDQDDVYDDSTFTTSVVGTRDATEEELKWIKWQIEKDEQAVRDREANALATLRKQYPQFEITEKGAK